MDDTGSHQTQAIIQSDDNYWNPDYVAQSKLLYWLEWAVITTIALRIILRWW